MKARPHHCFSYSLILISLLVLAACPCISHASQPAHLKFTAKSSEKLVLKAGKSIVVDVSQPVKRIAIAQPPANASDKTALAPAQSGSKESGSTQPPFSGSPAIVNAMVITPRQIYLNGIMPGISNITLWGAGDAIIGILDIEVVPDLNRLKKDIHTMFPGEKNVGVGSSHDHLTLSGTVSSLAAADRILELARSYAPMDTGGKPKIVNLLEIGGVHQVMLEVRVSEMSRSLARRLGFNFAFVSESGRQIGLSLLNNLVSLPTDGWPENPLQLTNNINMASFFPVGGAEWGVFIDALKENGLLKVLAEPTLITLSGKEARFLAGGEFPIPVPQSSGSGGTTITIDYKPYGVGLAFTPVVLSSGKISMQVSPEVSDLDFTTAVSNAGYIIPSINTRRVSTTVELADGQSFAIAGLLKDDTREVVKRFPVLGEIPILGALFRSTSYQRRETELIVIVTPHLVKPVDLAKQTKPTDQYVEPNDFEFYLLGMVEGLGNPKSAAQNQYPAPKSGSKGGPNAGPAAGHVLPGN